MRGIKIGSKFFDKLSKRQYSEPEPDYDMSKYEEMCNDERMKDLLHRIGQTIDDWAIEYQMEKIPKKIIFEQVLDSLNAIERNVNNKRF